MIEREQSIELARTAWAYPPGYGYFAGCDLNFQRDFLVHAQDDEVAFFQEREDTLEYG